MYIIIISIILSKQERYAILFRYIDGYIPHHLRKLQKTEVWETDLIKTHKRMRGFDAETSKQVRTPSCSCFPSQFCVSYTMTLSWYCGCRGAELRAVLLQVQHVWLLVVQSDGQ